MQRIETIMNYVSDSPQKSMTKCICLSIDTDKTGHREGCPKLKTVYELPPMIKRAQVDSGELNRIVAQLVRTVKAQQERIEILEKLVQR